MKTISPQELFAETRQAAPPLLLDVRLAEDFAVGHIPGSRSNCVFETVFTKRLSQEAPDPSRPVRVIGWNAASQEARMAAEKLERLGFTDVRALEGGIEGWLAARLPLDRPAAGADPQPASPPPLPDGRAEIDTSESRLEWLGRNLLNKHHGSAPITRGHLEFRNGLPCGGEFVINLNGITCADLAGSPLHDVLIAHLKDHDFFDTALNPEAVFRICSAKPLPGATPGAPNLHIIGDLTLRGRAHPVSFDAVAGFDPAGRPAAQAAFSIDRTKWGVLYGSGRFFKNLAGHLVNDLIEIQVRILANRPNSSPARP